MDYIDELERELRDLARTITVASRSGSVTQWMLRFDEFTREVRQAMLGLLKAEIEHRILPGIEVLNEVLIGMQKDRRREENEFELCERNV